MVDVRSFVRALAVAALVSGCWAGSAALAQDGPKPGDPPPPPPPPPTAEPREEAPKTEPAAPGESPKYSWKRVGIGTVLVLKVSMKGEGMSQDASMRYTLVSLGDTSAKVKMDMLGPDGATLFSTEQDMPLTPVMDGQEVLEKKTEKIDVGAGSFECDYMKMKSNEGGQEVTAELWLVADLPLPVKAVAKSPVFTSTMELEKVEKK